MTNAGPGGKEKHRLSDFLRRSVPPHRRFGGKMLALRRSAFIHLDPTRRNAINAHFRRKSLGHGLGEHVQRGL